MKDKMLGGIWHDPLALTEISHQSSDEKKERKKTLANLGEV